MKTLQKQKIKTNILVLSDVEALYLLARGKLVVKKSLKGKRYDEAFKDLCVTIPAPPEPNTKHARHLYTLLLKLEDLSVNRDHIQQELHQLNIGTGIHFISLHLHPYYRNTFSYRKEDFPNALYVSERTISLPLSAKLTDTDVQDVIDAVTTVLEKFRN